MNFIEGFTFERSSGVAFYGAGFLTNAAFLQLATRWPQVSRRWREADAALADYGRPRGLHARLRLTAASLMCFALVEHVLANITNLVTSVTCSSGGFDWLRRYCQRAYPQVFSLVAYDHGRCLVFWATNVIDTFAWNFMDLFVMLLSMVLAARFHQLNSRLHALRGKMLTQNEWRRLREDYDTLCQLTRDVDSSVCNIVLLSCANNLYFICLQLFNSLKPMRHWGAVYFYVSFAVLFGRTIAVLFLAARVNDQSKGPLPVLFQVPSDSYCVEVERLMDQVIWDEVAFTGLKFFSITRKLILTVAGTIATYEVVLLQLNDVNAFSRTEQQSLNSTEPTVHASAGLGGMPASGPPTFTVILKDILTWYTPEPVLAAVQAVFMHNNGSPSAATEQEQSTAPVFMAGAPPTKDGLEAMDTESASPPPPTTPGDGSWWPDNDPGGY
ncbi:gustatory receptor for sugar taste 64a-like [Schistocerca gregaria]|uniref:gustatory receptor for sugar taste 64a-like n=1 Tax=Schistocerca gregaria TaxID=7010 RepID=UPI00211E4411|nr:gustatory receptor for sugar taste 64a-like [Schistocerca gregaria]